MAQLFFPYLFGAAQAATPEFADMMVRFDRLQASTPTTGTICSVLSASNITAIGTSGTTLAVTFPAGSTLGVVGNWTTNTTSNASWPTGAVAWTGISAPTGSGIDNVGKVANFNITGASNPASAGTYCFNWTNSAAYSTASAGSNLTGSVAFNSGTYPGTTQILASNYATAFVTSDQVIVTATVPPTFSFSLSGASDTFTSNLSTSLTSTSGVTITVGTNASGGWIAWAKGTNQSTGAAGKGALTSVTSAGYSIPTTNVNNLGSAAHIVTTGPTSEDYGLAVTTFTKGSNGTGTNNGLSGMDTAYADNGGTTKVGVLDTTLFRRVAFQNGTTSGDTFVVKERATIANHTPAGTDYTDTITFIGAGSF